MGVSLVPNTIRPLSRRILRPPCLLFFLLWLQTLLRASVITAYNIKTSLAYFAGPLFQLWSKTHSKDSIYKDFSLSFLRPAYYGTFASFNFAASIRMYIFFYNFCLLCHLTQAVTETVAQYAPSKRTRNSGCLLAYYDPPPVLTIIPQGWWLKCLLFNQIISR